MKEYFLTTQEFANLHKVNKRTLHYYDEIGLFSPAKIGENGYRYYTYIQSMEFEIILALRDLGMSIDEIKDYQKHRTTEELSQMFLEKSNEIDEKIKQLKEVKKILNKKRENLILTQSEQINNIDVIYCKKEYLMVFDVSEFPDEREDLSSEMVNDIFKFFIHDKPVRTLNSDSGFMLPVKYIYEEKYDEYKYFFFNTSKKTGEENLFIKPEGYYLRGFCKGDWDKIPETYKKMLDYARENNIELLDYAYEIGLNDLTVSTLFNENKYKNYVTQITIPCRKINE